MAGRSAAATTSLPVRAGRLPCGLPRVCIAAATAAPPTPIFVSAIAAAVDPIAPSAHVTAADAAVTIITMLVMVLLAERGVRLLKLGRLERYTHAMAGVTILGSGLAIRFLGL